MVRYNYRRSGALPYIILLGTTFLLMVFFDEGQKGIITFKNLFHLSLIVTFILFAFGAIKESLSIIKKEYKKKNYRPFVIQVTVTLCIIMGAGSFVWVMVDAILKNIG